MENNNKSTITCSTCKTNVKQADKKCQRCGVIIGDPLQNVFDELEKYEEGCEPRSSEELRCPCGREDGKIKRIDNNM